MRDMGYSFRPHLARKWRGRGTGESVAKIDVREGGSEASRGGDGEGGGGNGRGLWMGACMDGGGGGGNGGSGEGGGGQGCGLGSGSGGHVCDDRGEGCGWLGGGGLGANAASGLDADGGRCVGVEAVTADMAVAVAAVAEVERKARWQWRERRLVRGAGARGREESAMAKRTWWKATSIEMHVRTGEEPCIKAPS